MFDEKKLIEKVTGIPEFYRVVELLKDDLSLSTRDGVQMLSGGQHLVYKNAANPELRMEILYNEEDKGVSLSYQGKDKKTAFFIIRPSDKIIVHGYDGENKFHILVENNKIHYYNSESMRIAGELLNGLPYGRNVKEYESVAVYPDDMQDISSAGINLNEAVFLVTTYVKELLFEKQKTEKR